MEVNKFPKVMKPSSSLLFLMIFINLVGCANQTHVYYLLELQGNPDTRCEILNDKKIIGSFTVPSSVNLGSKVGKLEANCTLNNKSVVSKIQSADAQCQDQLVVKDLCPKPTSTVKSVEIIIRQSR